MSIANPTNRRRGREGWEAQFLEGLELRLLQFWPTHPQPDWSGSSQTNFTFVRRLGKFGYQESELKVWVIRKFSAELCTLWLVSSQRNFALYTWVGLTRASGSSRCERHVKRCWHRSVGPIETIWIDTPISQQRKRNAKSDFDMFLLKSSAR